MTATLYITRTIDMIRFGWPSKVTLDEPTWLSRTWIRRVEVELPDGFEVGRSHYDEPMICRDGWGYELTVNAKDVPCIIDHTERGRYIPLTVLSEGE